MTGRRVRQVVLVIGIPSLIVAAWFAARELGSLESPPWWALVPAALLNLFSLWAGARSWDALLPAEIDRQEADDSFYTSQLMKYSPVGGAAQAVSQAALASGSELPALRATTAMVVSKLTVVIAGGVFGPVLALSNPDLDGWVRLLLLLTPLVFLVGHPRVLAGAVSTTARLLRRDPDHEVLPPQPAVWRSIAWGVPALGAAGASFAVLASAAGLGANLVQATAGFALAWVIGFLVIPVPGGLGVREGAAALLVAGDPASTLVAAVLFRVVVLATEALMVARVRLRARRARSHHAGTSGTDGLHGTGGRSVGFPGTAPGVNRTDPTTP